MSMELDEKIFKEILLRLIREDDDIRRELEKFSGDGKKFSSTTESGEPSARLYTPDEDDKEIVAPEFMPVGMRPLSETEPEPGTPDELPPVEMKIGTDLERINRELSEQMENAKIRIENLREENRKLKDEIKRLCEQIQSRDEKLNRLSIQLKTLDTSNAGLNAQLNDKANEINSLKKILEDKNS